MNEVYSVAKIEDTIDTSLPSM